ncbi:hypothetical protein L1887_18247 [Cichorium endivia]|nr:hypothetical protein L1887_18247 [Cichorium endivia]
MTGSSGGCGSNTPPPSGVKSIDISSPYFLTSADHLGLNFVGDNLLSDGNYRTRTPNTKNPAGKPKIQPRAATTVVEDPQIQGLGLTKHEYKKLLRMIRDTRTNTTTPTANMTENKYLVDALDEMPNFEEEDQQRDKPETGPSEETNEGVDTYQSNEIEPENNEDIDTHHQVGLN